jgi:hypothetical protein
MNREVNKNIKTLKRQRRVTLAEVIVVMLISMMLILISAIGIGAFFRKYKELNAWAELQKDGLECLNLIKNGVPVGSGSNMEYYGVTNAMAIQLTGTTTTSGSGIRITPPSTGMLDSADYAHFYLSDGVVRCTYVHDGIQVASPLFIFPKRENLESMFVEKFLITKVNTDHDLLAVQVQLDAKVKTGEDQDGKAVFRKIKFKTKMVKK